MGDKFSPALIEAKTGLRFESKSEPGEVGKRGRYRNIPQPYGSASIESPREDYTALQDVLDALAKNINVLRDGGVQEVKYYLAVSCKADDEQCNLEFDVAFLKTLADLRVPLLISVY
jgi:hypothetical protein